MYIDCHFPLSVNCRNGSYSWKFSIEQVNEFQNTNVTFKVPSTGPDSIIGVI